MATNSGELMELTDLQTKFFKNKGKRLNFLSGSVRSGKTYVSLLKWAMWVATMPTDTEYMMIGKTVGSLKRNCLNLLQTMVGANNFSYSAGMKTGVLFGRKIHLEGANDERSENKIRGMTLGGAYCDEITLFPESFVTMLLSRLSYKGAKLWATCNPDNPNHYIKTNYLDNEILDINVWNFILTDNRFLDEDYVKNIMMEYTGVYYQRFILGRWVRAEGIIYKDFADNSGAYIIDNLDELKGRIVLINIGVDFGGTKSDTTFVCTGITANYEEVVVLESKRISRDLDPTGLDNDFKDFATMCLNNYGKVGYAFCDSAEQILIRGIMRTTQKYGLPVVIQNASKIAIKDRIQLLIRLQSSGRFKIMRHCTTVVNALQNAVWDAKFVTEDIRLDDGTSDIDTMDALEYSFEKYAKPLTDYILRR